jgi:hypothetical protein
MRAFLLVVAAVTLICTALGSSAVSLAGDTWTCPPSTDVPSGVQAARGEILLVCKAGKAVVTPASGMSYTLTPSACFIGKTGAGLYFGSYPWNMQGRARSQILFIKFKRRANSGTRADIIDGVFRLLRPKREFAVLGTAVVRDGSRRGTFTIVEHLGAGVKGKTVATGQWDCGTRRTQ